MPKQDKAQQDAVRSSAIELSDAELDVVQGGLQEPATKTEQGWKIEEGESLVGDDVGVLQTKSTAGTNLVGDDVGVLRTKGIFPSRN